MGKTSWQVKAKYNNKVYTSIHTQLPKDMAQKFKEKCKEDGTSQRQVILKAVEDFLNV